MKNLQYFYVKSTKSMKEDLNIWMEGHDTSMDWKTQYCKDFSSLQINPQSNAILIKFSKKKKIIREIEKLILKLLRKERAKTSQGKQEEAQSWRLTALSNRPIIRMEEQRWGNTGTSTHTTWPTVQTESLKTGSHRNCHVIYNQGDTEQWKRSSFVQFSFIFNFNIIRFTHFESTVSWVLTNV